MTSTPPDNAAFFEHVELNEVRLLKLEHEISARYFAPAGSRRLGYELAEVQVSIDDEHNVAMATFRWSVAMTTTDPEEEPLFRVDATYLATFTGTRSGGEDYVRAFISRTGAFGTYPYLRAMVARLSDESGALLPPMPLFKGTPPPFEEGEQEEHDDVADDAKVSSGR